MDGLSYQKAIFDHTSTNGKGGFKTYSRKTDVPFNTNFDIRNVIEI
jgi:hypothetical protein